MRGGFAAGATPTSIVDHGTTRDGLHQLRRRWPVEGPVAAVLLVHGLGEHSGRYEHVGRQLADAGFFTVAFDHRGFGASAGPRAHVDRFTRYLDDLEDHLCEVRRLGVPVVVLGRSLGGLVAVRFVLDGRPAPDLLVLSGPALGDAAPRWMRLAAPPLAAVAPRLRVVSPVESTHLTRDPDVARAFDADPLVERMSTARLGAEIFDAMAWARTHVASLDVPTLVLHGADDELVPTVTSEILERGADVDRRVLAGLRHEPFNEPEGPLVLDQVIVWIRDRLGA